MTAVETERVTTNIETLPVDPRAVVSMLRSAVLRLVAADIELDASAASISLFGVVIETSYPDSVTSLVALADGSISLYVNNGTGCIGCGSNQEVRRVGAELLEAAEQSRSLATLADGEGEPPSGFVRFHFLLPGGRRSIQVRLETLSSIDTTLGALYFSGQRLLNVIERAGAGQSIEQEIRVAQRATPTPQSKGSPCLSVGNAVRRLLP